MLNTLNISAFLSVMFQVVMCIIYRLIYYNTDCIYIIMEQKNYFQSSFEPLCWLDYRNIFVCEILKWRCMPTLVS